MRTRTHSNQFQARAVHGTKGQPATTLIAGTPIANARSSPILLSERPCAKTTTTTSHLTPRPHVLHYDQHAFCSSVQCVRVYSCSGDSGSSSSSGGGGIRCECGNWHIFEHSICDCLQDAYCTELSHKYCAQCIMLHWAELLLSTHAFSHAGAVSACLPTCM